MLFFGQVLSKPMSKFLPPAEMLILPNQPLSPPNGSSSFVSSSLRLDPSSVQSPRISMSSSLGVPSKVRPPYYPGKPVISADHLTYPFPPSSGVGGSGGFIAILTIIAQVARIEIRPILLGSFGGVFGLASIFGPLLGGSSSHKLVIRTLSHVCFSKGFSRID
jgi:hypothetical protein